MNASNSKAPHSISRRQFISLALSTPLIGSFSGCTSFYSPVEKEEVLLKLPLLPKNFDGYKIGFLSDIHLSQTIADEVIEEAVSIIRKANVDLLLLGGDFIFIPRSPLATKLAQWNQCNFQGLQSEKDLIRTIFPRAADLLASWRPPDGIFAVYGNHDRWEEPALCRKAFERKGATFLVNASASISRAEQTLTIMGVDDYWTGVPAIPLLPQRTPAKELRLLLAHNPDFVSFLLNRGRQEFDLALCGHTHGGQIKVPLLGALNCNVRDARMQEGLFCGAGDAYVYTTRGIGTVEIPLRINCRAEATVITLTQS